MQLSHSDVVFKNKNLRSTNIPLRIGGVAKIHGIFDGVVFELCLDFTLVLCTDHLVSSLRPHPPLRRGELCLRVRKILLLKTFFIFSNSKLCFEY